MTAESQGSAADALLQRQARWRPGEATASPTASRRLAIGAAFALTALAALVLSTALIVAPLFSWQTAAVALVVGEYPPGVLTTVPFAREDTDALAVSLSGRLASSVSGRLLELKGLDTEEAMRDRLRDHFLGLPLRRRDSLIAYVRGQCLVPPPLLDADGNERPDPLSGHACLVTSDASLRGSGLREMVSCRDIVESIGSAPNLTTLVAMDLGDLRWDPRIGALCSLVPRQLDEDFKAPPLRAVGQTWLIASHDTLQYSGVSDTARRTFFAAALEQGLAGAADRSPWGDDDRVVELHELAPFVSAWTFEWSRRVSGGRALQRPTVWKLGVGRVAVRDIPRDIPLIRVSPPTGTGSLAVLRRMLLGSSPVQPKAPEAAAEVPTPPPSSPSTPPASPTVAATPPTDMTPGVQESVAATPAAVVSESVTAAAPASQGVVVGAPAVPQTSEPTPPAEQVAAPAAAPSIPAPGGPWDVLESLTKRVGPHLGPTPRPTVVDFAPHLWRQAASFVAMATTEVALAGPRAESSREALRRFTDALKGVDAAASSPEVPLTGSPEAEALADARSAARAAGIPGAWDAMPRSLRAAIAARNDAIELGWNVLDVMGQLGGGAGTPVIQSEFVGEFIASIARLSAEIARVSALTPTERDTARLDPVNTRTQYMLSQTSLMRSLRDQLLSGFDVESAAALRVPLHDRLILLRSRLPDPAQRARLLPFAATRSGPPAADDGNAKVAEPVLTAVGRPPEPGGPPRAIDRSAWKNCAAHTAMVVDLVEAAGVTAATSQSGGPAILQPLLDDIASARRAIAALNDSAGEESAAVTATARLAARMTKLFQRAAMSAAQRNAGEGHTGAVDSDRVGALLRILDPRDAGLVGARMLVGPGRWNAASRYGLRMARPDTTPPRVGVASDVEVSIVDAAGVPAEAVLAPGFDPAQIEVLLQDGTRLGNGVSIRVRDLPWRGGLLTLKAVPLRNGATGDRSNTANFVVTLLNDGYAESAELSLPLPAQRGAPLAARGEAWSVAGIPGPDGWVRAVRPAPAARNVAANDMQTPTLMLSGRPARVTTWRLGLDTLAGALRKVDVELYAVRVTRLPDDRERAWNDAAAALLEGRFPDAPLARATAVALEAAGQVVPLVLDTEVDGAGPTKKDAAAGAASTDSRPLELPPPQRSSGGAVAREVGPDLALVVRETEGAADARTMITRIALAALHPRDVLSAVARYDHGTRTITVSLGPADGSGGSLPADGLRVTLRDSDTEAAGGGVMPANARSVVPRKPVAVLSATKPTDDLIAAWKGPDQGTARFSLEVDGYPRSFMFAVDCSSAADMRPQGPQHDWRQIRILAPQAATTLVKAPADSVPMRLAVDAPADTFLGSGGAGGAVGIVMRRIGGETEDSETERVVWTAAGDRQVTFTLEPAPTGASLAIRTTVDDWTIAADGAGYANVDVAAEARLLIAGSQSPLTDSRVLVFDGQAPSIDAPPSVQATVGAPLVVPIQASDDSADGYLIPPERRRPGVSGLKSVEWALDPEGRGAPKEWQPAVGLGGIDYEVRIDSATLPFGVRLPLLVRATDGVGLCDPPTRIWVEVGATPASKRNSMTGKVVQSGRGEPGLPVVLSGPGGDRTVRTQQGGVFRFDELEPGKYTVSVRAAVRNQMRTAEPTEVTVEASPAAAANVMLELK